MNKYQYSVGQELNVLLNSGLFHCTVLSRFTEARIGRMYKIKIIQQDGGKYGHFFNVRESNLQKIITNEKES